MDRMSVGWYYSRMSDMDPIPIFTLFGETGTFPDIMHHEWISERARGFGWVISPHRHAQITQLFLIEAGHADALVDNTAWHVGAGEFLLVPAQAVHGFKFARNTEGQVFSFPLPLMRGPVLAGRAITDCLLAPFRAGITKDLSDLTFQLVTALHGNGRFRAYSVTALSQAVMAAVAELADTSTDRAEPEPDPRVAQLDALIARHLPDGWGARDYADALAISTGHLSRLCKRATGQSSANYIEASAMVEACRLLAFTQMPVAEVGYRLGYQDPSYFSRRFRTRQGEPPSAYRARFSSQG